MATRVKATKAYKALLLTLGSDEAATAAWNAINPDKQIGTGAPALTADEQALVDAGFTVEQAKTALAATPVETVAAPPAALTSKEKGEVLITQANMVPIRGRVYGNGAMLEAGARVLKTGTPELVRNSGDTRTKAVLVFRTDDGTAFAFQNVGVVN